MFLWLAATLGGCSGFSSAPPSCDGMARRPLNRSMWDWENVPASAPPSLPLMRRADAESPLRVAKATNDAIKAHPHPPRFDIAASTRACGREG
ncbi:MAG: type IV secretion pathway protein [Alphaproteobacteria bacterium]|nr:type IV secretion pathway protein [Alphaproteobacteria bacterium]